jgi:cysteine desulfurase
MIYLDHAATTPCRPEVAQAMVGFLTETFGNPSSVHAAGQAARQALDAARDRVANALGARAEEILFTASGTEADNLALVGSFLAQRGRKNHLVSATTEHHAILHTIDFLRAQGVEATLVPVDSQGRVDPDEVRRAIRPDTFLISLMAANNEIGTLAPLAEVAQVAQTAGVPLHTDAVQVVGALPVNVNDPRVDMLTLSAHKFYGPKGAAALYVRRKTPLKSIIHGGGQERERRAGTENVPGIAGLALALELAVADQPAQAPRQAALRDRLIAQVLADAPGAVLNGHPTHRLPNNANFSFPGLEADLLLLNLDLEGVCASSGSACTAGAVEPSHVLAALGLPHDRAISALRLTVGRSTTKADVDAAAAILARVVRRLRG